MKHLCNECKNLQRPADLITKKQVWNKEGNTGKEVTDKSDYLTCIHKNITLNNLIVKQCNSFNLKKL